MLRITRLPSIQVTTLSLEGKLLEPWLDALRAAIATAQVDGAVRLNLAQLNYIDHAGVALLLRLQRDGVEISGASAFIARLLDKG